MLKLNWLKKVRENCPKMGGLASLIVQTNGQPEYFKNMDLFFRGELFIGRGLYWE